MMASVATRKKMGALTHLQEGESLDLVTGYRDISGICYGIGGGGGKERRKPGECDIMKVKEKVIHVIRA